MSLGLNMKLGRGTEWLSGFRKIATHHLLNSRMAAMAEVANPGLIMLCGFIPRAGIVCTQTSPALREDGSDLLPEHEKLATGFKNRSRGAGRAEQRASLFP